MPNWFKTDKPLEDGVYFRKTDWMYYEWKDFKDIPCIIVDGKVYAAGIQGYDYDFSGYWSGPIVSPEFDGAE